MKKYVITSIFNAFFNLFFCFFIIFSFNFEESYFAYILSVVMVLICSHSILKWYKYWSKNIIINAQLSLFDYVIKSTTVISGIILFFYYQNYEQPIMSESLIFQIQVIFMFSIIARYFNFLSTLDKKNKISKKIELINKNSNFYPAGSFIFNFELLSSYILNYTNSKFYIIPDNFKIKETNIEFNIYSNNRLLVFDYIKNSFIIDGCFVKSGDIEHFQIEYNKKLFEMTEQELNTIIMWSI